MNRRVQPKSAKGSTESSVNKTNPHPKRELKDTRRRTTAQDHASRGSVIKREPVNSRKEKPPPPEQTKQRPPPFLEDATGRRPVIKQEPAIKQEVKTEEDAIVHCDLVDSKSIAGNQKAEVGGPSTDQREPTPRPLHEMNASPIPERPKVAFPVYN